MSSILRSLSQGGRKAQWVAHDHAGKRAAQRRLRQQQARQARATKAVFGVPVDAKGRTPEGLIVPGAHWDVRPSMGGGRR